MPRFYTSRDIALFHSINKELINTFIDTKVDVFKINQYETKENLYGESLKKIYFPKVSVGGFIEHEEQAYEQDEFGNRSTQNITVKFHKKTLEDIALYIEVGDIIEWDNKNYSINSIIDNQLLAGRPSLKHSIICRCNKTRRSKTKIREIKRAAHNQEYELYK